MPTQRAIVSWPYGRRPGSARPRRHSAGGWALWIFPALFCAPWGAGAQYFQENWKATVSSADQVDVDLAVDSIGRVFMVWEDGSSGNADIYFAVYDRSGVGLAGPVRLHAESASDEVAPTIAIEENGSGVDVFVAWQKVVPAGIDEVHVSHATDSSSWKFAIDCLISDLDAGSSNPDLSVRDGVAHATWEETAGGLQVVYRHGGETCESWAVDSILVIDPPLSGDQSLPRIVSFGTAPHDVVVTWQDTRDGSLDVFTARSSNGGGSFSYIQDVTPLGASDQERPALAGDSAGSLRLVWQDDRNGNLDIYGSVSDDGGRSWAPPACIADTCADTVSDQAQPSVAVGDVGEVYVSWEDDRYGRDEILLAKSLDRMTTFGATRRASSSLANGRLRPAIGYSDGVVFLAWEDDRDEPSSFDIYATSSAFEPVSFVLAAVPDQIRANGSDTAIVSSGIITDGAVRVLDGERIVGTRGPALGTSLVPTQARTVDGVVSFTLMAGTQSGVVTVVGDAVRGGGVGSVDVTIEEPPLFGDDFESGTLAAWQVRPPPQ